MAVRGYTPLPPIPDHCFTHFEFTYVQGSPMDRPPGGSSRGKLRGSSGSTDNPTSKKILFLYHSDHAE